MQLMYNGDIGTEGYADGGWCIGREKKSGGADIEAAAVTSDCSRPLNQS